MNNIPSTNADNGQNSDQCSELQVEAEKLGMYEGDSQNASKSDKAKQSQELRVIPEHPDLDASDALCAAATEGPWTYQHWGGGDIEVSGYSEPGIEPVLFKGVRCTEEDGAWVEHARTALPERNAECRAHREENRLLLARLTESSNEQERQRVRISELRERVRELEQRLTRHTVPANIVEQRDAWRAAALEAEGGPFNWSEYNRLLEAARKLESD